VDKLAQVGNSKYAVLPEIKGTIIGVTHVQPRGRIQIPKKVRDKLHLKERDPVYWLEGSDGRITIMKAVEIG
jgi:AbrB family looped-hinge helix DNA binding protein